MNSFNSSTNEIKNLRDLYNLALDEKNDEILKDCDDKIKHLLKEIKKK